MLRPLRRRLPRLPPVLLYVLRGSPSMHHAVNIRPIHPMFFSRSSARAFVLSLFRTHVRMAIEAAFPTTCSSLVTSPASRRGRDLGDVGERAHDVVGDARPQPRRGDDDGEEHHGGEERPGAAAARSSFRSRHGFILYQGFTVDLQELRTFN